MIQISRNTYKSQRQFHLTFPHDAKLRRVTIIKY